MNQNKCAPTWDSQEHGHGGRRKYARQAVECPRQQTGVILVVRPNKYHRTKAACAVGMHACQQQRPLEFQRGSTGPFQPMRPCTMLLASSSYLSVIRCVSERDCVGPINDGPLEGCRKPVGHFGHLSSAHHYASQAPQSQACCRVRVKPPHPQHTATAVSKCLAGMHLQVGANWGIAPPLPPGRLKAVRKGACNCNLLASKLATQPDMKLRPAACGLLGRSSRCCGGPQHCPEQRCTSSSSCTSSHSSTQGRTLTNCVPNPSAGHAVQHRTPPPPAHC